MIFKAHYWSNKYCSSGNFFTILLDKAKKPFTPFKNSILGYQMEPHGQGRACTPKCSFWLSFSMEVPARRRGLLRRRMKGFPP
jgi:hypothetical protein